MDPIYLDHNATAPMAPEVLEAMAPFWTAVGNSESRHQFGRRMRRAYDEARETVASILNAEPGEVVFTSGGTEANNLALFGLAGGGFGVCGPVASALPNIGGVVMSPIEHPAVAEPMDRLRAQGFTVQTGTVGSDGVVDLESMAGALDLETRLATLILAHNETGVIQPVRALTERAAELGIPVHTDAVQAVGRIPVDFRALGVATLAASAHKFHGPVGAGLLLVKTGVSLAPMMLGGGQQGARRPGTPAVALAVGMARALHLWSEEAEARQSRWTRQRDRLIGGLREAIGADLVIRTGPDEDSLRLPQTLHVRFPGLDGGALLMQLDLAGVAVSMGSACASGSNQPSPSLRAIGLPDDQLRSTVRFSLGAATTDAEIEEAVRRVAEVVSRIRGLDFEERADAVGSRFA